jgi:hypothetical protein
MLHLPLVLLFAGLLSGGAPGSNPADWQLQPAELRPNPTSIGPGGGCRPAGEGATGCSTGEDDGPGRPSLGGQPAPGSELIEYVPPGPSDGPGWEHGAESIGPKEDDPTPPPPAQSSAGLTQPEGPGGDTDPAPAPAPGAIPVQAPAGGPSPGPTPAPDHTSGAAAVTPPAVVGAAGGPPTPDPDGPVVQQPVRVIGVARPGLARPTLQQAPIR